MRQCQHMHQAETEEVGDLGLSPQLEVCHHPSFLQDDDCADPTCQKYMQRGSSLSKSIPDRSLSCQKEHISKPVQSAEEDGGEGVSRSFLPLFVGVLYACTRVPPAGALFKKKKKPETIDEFSGRIAKLYWPIMQNLGFSGAVGLASGLALRV